MASILYAVYAVVVLLVAGAGLLWVGFTVEGPAESDRRDRGLSLLGAAFVLVMIGLFLI